MYTVPLSTSTSAPMVPRKERHRLLESLTVPPALENGAQGLLMKLMKLQVDTGTNCSLLLLPELKQDKFAILSMPPPPPPPPPRPYPLCREP